jgi:hypothetical protein
VLKKGACVDSGGYHAGKNIKGKKRHILVDRLGLVLHTIGHLANIQDCDGSACTLLCSDAGHSSKSRSPTSAMQTLCSGPQLPQACQGLRTPDPENPRIPAPRFNLFFAQKTMQSKANFPNVL